MRVWEIDDVKAMPGDMVREQDFIMRLRHLHRQATPCLIVNVIFAALDAAGIDLESKEQLQRQVAEATEKAGGVFHIMTNGDGFAVLPLARQDRQRLLNVVAAAALPPGAAPDIEEKLIHIYTLPGDYAPARERSNHYVEAARAAAQIGSGHPSPDRALQSDSVRGPLTPWILDQIEKLLEDIDIRRYVRHQAIYGRTDRDWAVAGAEYFVGVDELQRERFPRLDIRTPERLFMELCSALDQRLLNQFADKPESLPGGSINLNIAVETVLSTAFAKFTRSIPAARRPEIGFEINRGDLLLNLSTTLSAIETLRQEKFRVVIDALHPELLTYANVGMFDADYYKIRVSGDLASPFGKADVLKAFQALPREKVIFYRCDNEAALEIGRQLGVGLYQGWLIDDQAAEEKK